MDGIGQEQHPDFLAESGQRLGQSLAVLATLGEAAARLAAVEIRRRQWREAQDERRSGRLSSPPSPTSPDADLQRAKKHDRRLIAKALDDIWLDRADLLDLATVWRAARLRETQIPEARAAAEQVEDRLRGYYPGPMRRYDDAVRAGTGRAEAMRAAVEEMARTPIMRAHGGRRSAAINGGIGMVVDPDDLDAAVQRERSRLAEGLDSRCVADLRRHGAAGHAAADHLERMLAAHRTGAPGRAPGAHTPPQTAFTWYPEGTHGAGMLPAHVAGLRPANTSIQAAPFQAAARRAR
ncbi:hypothetical protein ACIA8K_29755 [Catenuloplanes sp. NPDC051500]|uniref:hypothetical protein n=1 Tax=Catenuloplanes sp. NPDC051500 TaxID=3363959 RepID=UPI003799AAB6